MWKLKYSFLDNNTNNLESFTNSNDWTNEKKWSNSGPYKKCMELAKILGPPNYVSYNNKGMVEFVKWQKDLNTDNFVYGAFKGVDMIKITDYVPKKIHPYEADVYVIVGKFIHVPSHLFGPLKYASETINIEQLSVPREVNQKFLNTGNKERALLTGSCASVTISAITIKFAEDMIARDKHLNFADVTQKLHKEYRKEYGNRLDNYLCGKGIYPKIDWFNHEDFKEKALIGPIPACSLKKNESFYNSKLNSVTPKKIEVKYKPHENTPKMKEVYYRK